MSSKQAKKLAGFQAKKTILEDPDGSGRPLWVQVTEAACCLAFGAFCIYLMMIIGVRAGL